jgi:hypothetical protein
MTHTHTYDSAVLYMEESAITPTMLGCACGAFATVGDTELPVAPMWQPEMEEAA